MVSPHTPVKLVVASRGKAVRAEPVVALYEQKRVHHVGVFQQLEDQLCQWVPGSGGPSPDRLDALVWAISELMVENTSSLALWEAMVGQGPLAGRFNATREFLLFEETILRLRFHDAMTHYVEQNLGARATRCRRWDKDPDTARLSVCRRHLRRLTNREADAWEIRRAAASSANALHRALSDIVSACCWTLSVGASDALPAPSIAASSRSRAVISRSGQR